MLRLDLTVTSGATRGWMARGSHSFTCHPHVYPRMEWAILHAFRKHSPDGVARARWRTSGSAYYSSIDPERMKGWVDLVGQPYSGWFTHISGHPSATGRAWDRESLPVKDRHSTTVPWTQPVYTYVCMCVCTSLHDLCGQNQSESTAASSSKKGSIKLQKSNPTTVAVHWS